MSNENNRVAVITGAAGGVGQSTVKKFVEHGYTVIGTDIRLPEGLFEHPSVSYQTCDVTSESDWMALAKSTVADHGKLDVLVNNAVILVTYTIETSSLDDFKQMSILEVAPINLAVRVVSHAIRKEYGITIVDLTVELIGYDYKFTISFEFDATITPLSFAYKMSEAFRSHIYGKLHKGLTNV